MWNYEGMTVSGVYLGDFKVTGRVELSRVKYGGRVCHTVVLNSPITVYGAIRERVILDHEQITSIKD